MFQIVEVIPIEVSIDSNKNIFLKSISSQLCVEAKELVIIVNNLVNIIISK